MECVLLFVMYVAVPSSGFTQRATLDPELNEIHVLTVSNAFTEPLLHCVGCFLNLMFFPFFCFQIYFRSSDVSV